MDQNFATALTRVFRDDEAPPLPAVREWLK